ncbi:hypothetical protein ACMD2_19342, partial [Ananas comosus]
TYQDNRISSHNRQNVGTRNSLRASQLELGLNRIDHFESPEGVQVGSGSFLPHKIRLVEVEAEEGGSHARVVRDGLFDPREDDIFGLRAKFEREQKILMLKLISALRFVPTMRWMSDVALLGSGQIVLTRNQLLRFKGDKDARSW